MARSEELHECELVDHTYDFRAPSVYDMPRLRRNLTMRGLRYPAQQEFRIAALAGVGNLAELAGDAAEGKRQTAILEEWYENLDPIDEETIDEPDFELRAQEKERLEAEQAAVRLRLLPDVSAIEANLQRHFPPYRELLADRTYWDDVSAIDVVRLLLVRMDGRKLATSSMKNEEDMVDEAAYRAIPLAHRGPLAVFARALFVPTEAERKN